MEQVILLHGILRTGRSMRRMEKHFTRAGFKVFNVTYPSRKHNIAKLAELISADLRACGFDENKRTHIVCHSMGGLITRVLIASGIFKNLGRVVFLGTPHKGSEIADRLKDWKLYRMCFGPAGAELTTAKYNQFLPSLNNIDFEAAAIAGTISISFVGSYIIGRKSDGTVAVDSVQAEGLKDFMTVRMPHSFLMESGKVIKASLRFIKQGSF